ncbi:type I phosphomannose isomerase catalytic subunit [Clostridium lundense]|uniref:type I phosphomannose isomerase catalytic subunit n=1 Tax=Clostridium lundense TaxID=319475 RepID=UPI0006891C2A|nr:type I phosphomannose isomerase catalytic subunit [Clostridium lundense]
MYPLKFQSIYFLKIWGGRTLQLFRNNLPKGSIGESWDVACHHNGTSIISNGKFKGMKLDDLIQIKGNELLGNTVSKYWFPLLVKLISTEDMLSVQVHPDDTYAKNFEGEMGKNEAWYVLEAFEGANIIVGTKNCTKEQFLVALKNGVLDKYLNKIPVKKGDVFFIKSGLVHAIGKGIIIAEIQQNSDITYRVFDYNRGRELHVAKALDVIDLSLKGEPCICKEEEYDGYIKTPLCSCDKFTIDLIKVNTIFKERSDKDKFFIITCVEGQGKIKYSNGEETFSLGDSVLIPAYLGEYAVEGNIKFIKSQP